ncbi:MAG TPA: hypothetical protein VMM12_08560 [Longimicrobiales bacterium]|nr:hypothetical protein [Longimicrobiales bacterium]
MRLIRVAIAAAVAVSACGGDDGGGEIRFEGQEVQEARRGWTPELAALVDSGNAAYRTGNYDEAARIFQRGTREFPHHGATWFGLYMAEHARGNIAAADSALGRAEALTPSLPRDSAPQPPANGQ